jgi:hypothetical protein
MRVTTGGAGPFAGLPAEVIEVMAGALVQEKVLAEFGVGLVRPQRASGPDGRDAACVPRNVGPA